MSRSYSNIVLQYFLDLPAFYHEIYIVIYFKFTVFLEKFTLPKAIRIMKFHSFREIKLAKYTESKIVSRSTLLGKSLDHPG